MRQIERFKSDQRGSVALMFGLAMIPVLGLAGAAIDYSRASLAHTKLQVAIDRAALGIVKLPATATQTQMDDIARASLKSVFGFEIGERSQSGVTIEVKPVQKTGKIVVVQASGTSDSAFMQLLGFQDTKFSATSKAEWNSNKIELALVLDSTGSMADDIGGGQRKIDALKQASTQLLSDLKSAAVESDTVKVSVVPFDTEVRLNPSTYRSKPWFDWSRSGTKPANWTGYIFDRYNSYAISDAAPSVAVPDSLFPAPEKSEFAKYGSLQPIQPLTSLFDSSGYSALTGAVAGMNPRGNTNIALGAMWGYATLTPSEPFTEAQPFSNKKVKKYMLILTDGDNTMNHVNGAQDSNVAQIDTKTRAACTAAKDAGIEIFTIRLKRGNVALLQSCASPTTSADVCTQSGSRYFDVQDATQLSTAFSCIVKAISGTRITS